MKGKGATTEADHQAAAAGEKTGKNMADFQHIKCKNKWNTSPNRGNFALYKETWVGKTNGGV